MDDVCEDEVEAEFLKVVARRKDKRYAFVFKTEDECAFPR